MIKGALEAVQLGDRAVSDVDRAVEHHVSHPLRVGVGVERTNHGAVREAQIVDLAVSDQAPEQIKITNSVRGRDVLQQGSQTSRARPAERLRSAITVFQLRIVIGRGIQGQIVIKSCL